MEYMSCPEAAEKWGISERRVQILCKENRISGVSKIGYSITITAFQRNENVVFELENTGVHIPENEIPKLFDAFYRIEHSRNRKTGGSGLGLYIVKAILEQHQATYSINNTSNGVLFSIHF